MLVCVSGKVIRVHWRAPTIAKGSLSDRDSRIHPDSYVMQAPVVEGLVFVLSLAIVWLGVALAH